MTTTNQRQRITVSVTKWPTPISQVHQVSMWTSQACSMAWFYQSSLQYVLKRLSFDHN